MKLIIATESYPPTISGVAVQAQRCAQWAKSAGFEVMVITNSIAGTNRNPSVPIEDGTSIYCVRSIKNPWRPQNRISLWFWGNRKIRDEIDRFQPDLIHFHDPGSLSSGMIKIAKKRKIPVIAHHHFSEDFIKSYLQSFGPLADLVFRLVNWHIRRLYRSVDLILVPTEFTKNQLKSWGIKQKIEAITNGIDLDRFYPGRKNQSILQKYQIDPKRPFILYLGRIDQDKNCRTLVEAAKIINQKDPEIQFVFVGDGYDRQNLEQTSPGRAAPRRVSTSGDIFTGAIDRSLPDIPAIYRSADIFWSASPIETQGIVFLEALASGIPVVAAQAGATVELIKAGKNGELCPTFDTNCFAEKTLDLLKDKARLKKYQKNGLQTVRQHSVENARRMLLTKYQEIGNKK